MKDEKVAPAPPAPDADRWLAALVVVVPAVVAIAASLARADPDETRGLLSWWSALSFFAPLSWALGVRRRLRRVVLPGVLLILVGAVSGMVLGAVWWLRSGGDLADYGAVVPVWLSGGAAIGAGGAGALVAGDVGLRLLAHRGAPRACWSRRAS